MLSAIIQIVTGVEVIVQNFWPEVCKILPRFEIEGNISQTEEKKIF